MRLSNLAIAKGLLIRHQPMIPLVEAMLSARLTSEIRTERLLVSFYLWISLVQKELMTLRVTIDKGELKELRSTRVCWLLRNVLEQLI